jgi:hypothetical protein
MGHLYIYRYIQQNNANYLTCQKNGFCGAAPAGGADLGDGGRDSDAVAPADAELLDAYSRAVNHVVERVGPVRIWRCYS